MVFFTCDACGQAVKKNQVEKHYTQQCRNCQVLSCIDCGKEFWGDEFKSHTKCISEEEKYGGKEYKPKANSNKGELKQEQWVRHIQEVIRTNRFPPMLADLLHQLTEFTNIPRKKIKFENFVKNSIRVRNPKIVSQAWEVFSKAHNQSQVQQNQGTDGLKVVKTETDKAALQTTVVNKVLESCKDDKTMKKRKKQQGDDVSNGSTKKLKTSECSERIEPQSNDVAAADDDMSQTIEGKKKKFKWEKVITSVLKEADDNELPVKKLRRKVLAAYHFSGGENKPLTDNELKAKFEKKISSNPKFKVHKDRVKLK